MTITAIHISKVEAEGTANTHHKKSEQSLCSQRTDGTVRENASLLSPAIKIHSQFSQILVRPAYVYIYMC